MEKAIWVLGHVNPDTDSICAALAYAELKRNLGIKEVKAGRVGPLNRETAYVLERLGVEPPPLVTDVRSRVMDMLQGEVVSCSPETTLQGAGRLMREKQVKTLPVVDQQGRLLGIITIGDIARHLLEELDLEKPTVSPTRVQEILSAPISSIMKSEGIVTFQDDDLVAHAKRVMLETRYRNYPVVDEHERLLGMIARYDLLALRRRQVILVDHSERSQAVGGIEEAQILEIIDHHRLGDVQTSEPLYFRCEPVGSTCTIISSIFEEHAITPSPTTAALLCAGILSDTVIFKSPTSTAKDRAAAEKLAKTARLELEPFGREMFRAGSALEDRPPEEILREDFKTYSLGELKVGIGQVEALGIEGLDDVKKGIERQMERLVEEEGYDLVLMMLTDIIAEGTELLVAGPAAHIVEEAFGRKVERNRVFLPGVMSRKKQLVPPLIRMAALR
ncbi:MAG: putative manganese-dependent inorganic diphosphatase [Thermacetogeniaceae bacterium]